MTTIIKRTAQATFTFSVISTFLCCLCFKGGCWNGEKWWNDKLHVSLLCSTRSYATLCITISRCNIFAFNEGCFSVLPR